MSISVALCTWNGEQFLPELLDSLAAQRLAPDEIVVGDDCSDDDTIAILERFARRSRVPVHVHRHAARLGATANFSTTLARCRGELVALADQDDVWWPPKLEELVAAMSMGALLAFSDAVVVDDAGEELGFRLWEGTGVDAALDALSGDGAFDTLLDARAVTGCCAAVSARLLASALPVPLLQPPRAHRPLPHDAWLALCAAACGQIEIVRRPLLGYRRHAGQAIGVPLPGRAPAATPDWSDPSVAGAQVTWIETVLDLLTQRAAPLRAPRIDVARRRAAALSAGGRIHSRDIS